MTLRASTWFPWTFFGPLLLTVVSGALFELTRMEMFATLAKLGMVASALVALLAFFASRAARKRASLKPPDSDSR